MNPTQQQHQPEPPPPTPPPMSRLDVALKYETCRDIMNFEGICDWVHVGRLSDKNTAGERTGLTISERCKYCVRFRIIHYSYHAGTAGMRDTVRYIRKDYSMDITTDKATGEVIR